MKRTALLLIFALILGISIVLVSCSNNSKFEDTEPPVTVCTHNWKDATTSEPKTCILCGETEGEPLSATQVLNSDESSVYWSLKMLSRTLIDPSSLRLITLKGSFDDTVYAEVSAKNSYGGVVTRYYVIEIAGNYTTSGSALHYSAKSWPHSGSVGKINAALQEYFAEQGW